MFAKGIFIFFGLNHHVLHIHGHKVRMKIQGKSRSKSRSKGALPSLDLTQISTLKSIVIQIIQDGTRYLMGSNELTKSLRYNPKVAHRANKATE